MNNEARILVVDDEAAIRFALQEILARDGYEVVAVESGEAALSRLATQEFHLALIDLRLRGIGGMEVLSALRSQSPDTAAIVLTAHGSLDTAVEALRQGAHDYLFKPCKPGDIRESVRRGLLKRQREQRQRELLAELEQTLSSTLKEIQSTASHEEVLPRATGPVLGGRVDRAGLVIDVERRVVTLEGHPLDLTRSEFDVLAYLVRQAPRVVSSEELASQVLGYEAAPGDARDVVRYHIYRIRQKALACAARGNLIRTKRGIGYTIGE